MGCEQHACTQLLPAAEASRATLAGLGQKEPGAGVTTCFATGAFKQAQTIMT